MLWRSVREVTVSKRRGRVGALNEEGDVINATSPLAMDGEDSDGTISRLANRIEELEKLIAAVRERVWLVPLAGSGLWWLVAVGAQICTKLYFDNSAVVHTRVTR